MTDRFKKFYELAGQKYPEDEITYTSLSGIMRKKWVTGKIAALPAGSLLDCGCNIGRLGARWKKGKVVGIDISLSVLKRGKMIFPEICFINGDLRTIGFLKDDSIDNAIAIEVIEHLDKPEDFLKGLYRVVKIGGKVLITAPGYSFFRPKLVDLGIIKTFGIDRGTEGDQYLHTAYKPEELARLAEKAGFTVVEEGSFEHEIRGWVKPLTIMTYLYNGFIAKRAPNSKLNYLFVRAMHALERNIFFILETMGFSVLLRTMFKEGRRSHVLAKKE